jgi:hypothetical protein
MPNDTGGGSPIQGGAEMLRKIQLLNRPTIRLAPRPDRPQLAIIRGGRYARLRWSMPRVRALAKRAA